MNARRRGGYTLLEMLAYVAILGVVLNISAQVLLTCVRLSNFGVQMADGIEQAQGVEDAFREAVREGLAVVPGAGAYATGADTVVLEAPGVEGRRFVVIGRLGQVEQVVVLRIVERNGTLEPEGMKAYPLKDAEVKFAYDAADPALARLVTMTVTPKGRDERPVYAALRGIVQR